MQTKISNKVNKFFTHALQYALESPMIYSLGAVATINGRVCAQGSNTNRSRMKLPGLDLQNLDIEHEMKNRRFTCASQHAEVNVMRQTFLSTPKRRREKCPLQI
jgi:hypothetical protein